MPASVFNKPATSYPVDANSAKLVGAFTSQAAPLLYANDPIYVVAAGTADSTISVQSGCNNFLSNTGTQVPVPAAAAQAGDSDNPMFLVDPSANAVWEFWQFHGSGATFTACWGGKATLSTFTGVFPGGYGESATGISYAATAVSTADVAQGAIKHAMAIAIGVCTGYVYPADRGDCGSSAEPAEGQMFRFAASVNCNLSGLAQLVCEAGKTYGFVIVDKTGQAQYVGLSAQEGVSGSLAGLPWSSLQAVDP